MGGAASFFLTSYIVLQSETRAAKAGSRRGMGVSGGRESSSTGAAKEGRQAFPMEQSVSAMA